MSSNCPRPQVPGRQSYSTSHPQRGLRLPRSGTPPFRGAIKLCPPARLLSAGQLGVEGAQSVVQGLVALAARKVA